MTRAELEAIVTELEEFEKANNWDALPDDNSPVADSRRELAFRIGQMLVSCNAFGFNPWPNQKEFFETYSISVLPEYPLFEKTVLLAHHEVRKVREGAPITDSLLFRMFDLVRRQGQVSKIINGQIPFPVDPRQKEWESRQAQKPKEIKPEKPREPFEVPQMPLETRDDVENALKEMYYFWRDCGTTLNDLSDFMHEIYSFGMASSFLGYWQSPTVPEKWKGVTIELLPDAMPIYMEMINKIYRLFTEVRDAGQPTARQMSRMYRLVWRAKKFARATQKRLRQIADQREIKPEH